MKYAQILYVIMSEFTYHLKKSVDGLRSGAFLSHRMDFAIPEAENRLNTEQSSKKNLSFADSAAFNDLEAESGVRIDLHTSADVVQAGATSGALSASSSRPEPNGAWGRALENFPSPLDLSAHQGLGVWIHGDGKGELLNFQVKCPEHLTGALGEHYVVVDFEGWRYFELIEPEGERYAEYAWPYGHAYSIYRENIDYAQTEALSLWYNNLPANEKVTCYLSPIKALPLIQATLRNPTLTIKGRKIVFPLEMESGSYLEFFPSADARLYGPQGELICEIAPPGEMPALEPGDNQVEFTCQTRENLRPRARVTVISQGDPLCED